MHEILVIVVLKTHNKADDWQSRCIGLTSHTTVQISWAILGFDVIQRCAVKKRDDFLVKERIGVFLSGVVIASKLNAIVVVRDKNHIVKVNGFVQNSHEKLYKSMDNLPILHRKIITSLNFYTDNQFSYESQRIAELPIQLFRYLPKCTLNFNICYK